MARFRPPVGMVPVIFPLLRSITLMVLSLFAHPELFVDGDDAVGLEVAPLLVVPVKPVMRPTYASVLVSKMSTALLSLSAR